MKAFAVTGSLTQGWKSKDRACGRRDSSRVIPSSQKGGAYVWRDVRPDSLLYSVAWPWKSNRLDSAGAKEELCDES